MIAHANGSAIGDLGSLAIDTEAERGVVGSMLYDPQVVPLVCARIRPADFADGQYRAVFEAIERLRHRREELGVVAVLHDLKGSPVVDDPHVLMASLAEAVTGAAHARHFADRVAETSRKRRVIDAAAHAIKQASRDGCEMAEVLADLTESIEAIESGPDRDGVAKFTFDKLRSEYPHLNDPVVDGLFRRGETANLIAASKVGKSWMAYGLALSIINGEPWLGRFETARGRVLLIDNELHPQTIASRVPKVAEAMGILPGTWDRDLTVWPLRGNLRSLEQLRADFDAIEPGEYQAVILDAKYRFATEGASENDNAAETQVYNLLDQYAAKTNAAFVLIHHASKGGQTDKAVTDVGAGAGAQSRATDCHMVIRPHEEDACAVFDAAVRSFPPMAPFAIRWAFPVWIPDERLDPRRLEGRQGKGQQKRAEEDQADRYRIYEALTEAGEPLTRKKLRKRVGLGDDRLKRLLDRMESDNWIDSQEVTIRGNITEAYAPLTGVVDDVDRPRPDHASTGETEGVGGPLKGSRPRPARLPEVGPGERDEPVHVPGAPGGPMPFPEFEEQAG